MLKRISLFVLAATTCLSAAHAAVPAKAVNVATEYFEKTLDDDTKLPMVLRGLESTGDKELLPLFVALSRSSDKSLRLMATVMLPNVAGKDAAPYLLERLQKDPYMIVRSEALVQLIGQKTITTDQLQKAMKLDDEDIQVIAARALAREKKGKGAMAVLEKLAGSRNADTATFARMTLLGLGDQRQVAHLRKVILDPETQPEMLMRMLNQIGQEKISAALPVAEFLARPNQLMPVRIRAFMAISELSPKAAMKITSAIKQSDSLGFQINLIRLLSERDDAAPYLNDFAAKNDALAKVARFEIARKTGGTAADRATADMFALEHPIVIEYVLNRMRKDIVTDKTKAEFYVKPVIAYINSVELDPQRMTALHDRVALAVELLGNMGTPTAMKGLWDLMQKPDNNPTKKLAVGALYRSKNNEVCDLIKPALKSVYPEMRTFAALMLARKGQSQAEPVLLDIQAHSDTNKPDVLTLTNWYLLKLSGQSNLAIKAICRSIR